MISNLLKEHKEEIYKMVMKNNTTKSLLKQIDGLWKRVEVLLAKDLKKAFWKIGEYICHTIKIKKVC